MAHKNTLRTLLIGIAIGLIALAVIMGFWLLYRWAANLWKEPPPPSPAVRCEATINETTVTLDLEQSRNATIIAGVATQRGLVPRAVSIGLTTAFQESGIRNLDYGDRDSLGIFQQRPSQGWGTVEQIMDPYYSTGKFYDAMVKVPNWQSADIGEVAQAVQRSGFPDAYDKHIGRARLIASALSGETPATWSCVVPASDVNDPDGFLTAMTRAYGASAMAQLIVGTGEEPTRIEVAASSERVAWSVGAFAQSWASETGVTAVTVGDYHWVASWQTLSGWTSSPNKVASATTVIIFF
jgi:hypothetical protein